MAGLEAAFLDTGADVIFLTGTDLPFGDPALARFLVDSLGEHDICLIRSDKGPEPLFAVYSSRCLPAIRKTLEEGRRSMYTVIQQMDTLELPAESLTQFDVGRILSNVNDPVEYSKALERL